MKTLFPHKKTLKITKGGNKFFLLYYIKTFFLKTKFHIYLI